MKKIFVIIILCFSLFNQAQALNSAKLAHSDDDKFKISLEEAMDLALKGNIELKEQRKNLGISFNNIKSADALRNPQLQSSILLGKIAKGNSSQIGLTLPVEVLKRGARKRSAEIGFLYTQDKIYDYEFKLKLRIRTAYFNLVLAKSELQIMQERKELLEDLLKITKERPKTNPNYEVEVLQADMKIKKQIVQINRAKTNVRTAQYAFNKTLNLEDNLTLYDAKEDNVFNQRFFKNLDLPGYEELETTAFNNRFDIKMAQDRVEKAKKDIDIAIKRRVPDLYVSGGYAFAFDGTPGAFVGAGMDIPSLYLFTPEIKNAKLEYEKRQLEYNAIINITKNIIHTNHDKFIMAQENVKLYNDIIEESKQILKITKKNYQKGASSLTNLIVVEHTHQELLNEYLKAIGIYYNAYISLLQELGLDNISIDVDL